MKTITPIKWKTWEPGPGEFTCMFFEDCHRDATVHVALDICNLVLCEACSELSEQDLKGKLGIK